MTILETSQTRLKSLLDKYSDMFKDELGTMNSIRAGERECLTTFSPSAPSTVRTKGSNRKGATKDGRIWISSRKPAIANGQLQLSPYPRKMGGVRICGDYKVTINEALDIHQYLLPNQTDLFASVANGKVFSKLDLLQAHQQMLLDSESQKYLTINTHLSLYQYTRLPFGVVSAPAMFQRAVDIILQGIPGVICYTDDILVSGETDEQHLNRLQQVLKRLHNRLKQKKCDFLKPAVEYLGHGVDKHGLHTLPSKVKAIVEAPEPNMFRS